MESATRDGRALRYIDTASRAGDGQTGGDQPTLVFVHGWSCDHHSFDYQLEHFARSYRVIAPDLRGHGASDPAPSYEISDFAEEVMWLCAQLQLDRPVLIGHSMGGMVVVEAAAAYPDAVRAAVVLDSPVTDFPGMRAGVEGQLALFAGPNRLSEGAPYLRNVLFGPYDDERRANSIADAMLATPPEVAVPSLASVIEWPERRRLLECDQPILCVHVAAGGPTDPTPLAKDRPNVYVAQTFGSGHFIQIEVADQVNAMIERFLSTLPAVQTTA